jgi:hypothetical protein
VIIALAHGAGSRAYCGYAVFQTARNMSRARHEAEQREHPVTLGICLIWACTVSLWRGDLVQAAERMEHLARHACRHSLRPFVAVAIGLKAEIEIACGAPDPAWICCEARSPRNLAGC